MLNHRTLMRTKSQLWGEAYENSSIRTGVKLKGGWKAPSPEAHGKISIPGSYISASSIILKCDYALFCS